MLNHPSQPPRGWVLYDGACGFCTATVNLVSAIIARRGFHPVPLQTPWVKEKTGLADADLLTDMRLLLADGRLISGADAYLYVMRKIWWAWPFAMLFSLPGLHWIFDRTYRFIAAHRQQISRACRVPPAPPHASR